MAVRQRKHSQKIILQSKSKTKVRTHKVRLNITIIHCVSTLLTFKISYSQPSYTIKKIPLK